MSDIIQKHQWKNYSDYFNTNMHKNEIKTPSQFYSSLQILSAAKCLSLNHSMWFFSFFFLFIAIPKDPGMAILIPFIVTCIHCHMLSTFAVLFLCGGVGGQGICCICWMPKPLLDSRTWHGVLQGTRINMCKCKHKYSPERWPVQGQCGFPNGKIENTT